MSHRTSITLPPTPFVSASQTITPGPKPGVYLVTCETPRKYRKPGSGLVLNVDIKGQPYKLIQNEQGYGVIPTSNATDRMYRNYQVSTDESGHATNCTCPDRLYRGHECKHMRAVNAIAERSVSTESEQGDNNKTNAHQKMQRARPVLFAAKKVVEKALPSSFSLTGAGGQTLEGHSSPDIVKLEYGFHTSPGGAKRVVSVLRPARDHPTYKTGTGFFNDPRWHWVEDHNDPRQGVELTEEQIKRRGLSNRTYFKYKPLDNQEFLDHLHNGTSPEAPDWRPNEMIPEDHYLMSRVGAARRYAAKKAEKKDDDKDKKKGDKKKGEAIDRGDGKKAIPPTRKATPPSKSVPTKADDPTQAHQVTGDKVGMGAVRAAMDQPPRPKPPTKPLRDPGAVPAKAVIGERPPGIKWAVKGDMGEGMHPALKGSRLGVVLKEIANNQGKKDKTLGQWARDGLRNFYDRRIAGGKLWNGIRDKLMALGNAGDERAKKLALEYNWHRVEQGIELDRRLQKHVAETIKGGNDKHKMRIAHNLFGHGWDSGERTDRFRANQEQHDAFWGGFHKKISEEAGRLGNWDMRQVTPLAMKNSLRRIAQNEENVHGNPSKTVNTEVTHKGTGLGMAEAGPRAKFTTPDVPGRNPAYTVKDGQYKHKPGATAAQYRRLAASRRYAEAETGKSGDLHPLQSQYADEKDSEGYKDLLTHDPSLASSEMRLNPGDVPPDRSGETGGGNTNPEAGFHAAIEANPNGTTERGGYADWLDDNDRPGQAAVERMAAITYPEGSGNKGTAVVNGVGASNKTWRIVYGTTHPGGKDAISIVYPSIHNPSKRHMVVAWHPKGEAPTIIPQLEKEGFIHNPISPSNPEHLERAMQMQRANAVRKYALAAPAGGMIVGFGNNYKGGQRLPTKNGGEYIKASMSPPKFDPVKMAALRKKWNGKTPVAEKVKYVPGTSPLVSGC